MQGLYAIIDVPHPHRLTLEEVTRGVLGERLAGGVHGASVVQLRAKQCTTAQRVEMLTTMAPLCMRAETVLLVNDDVEAALAGVPGVQGVHLGQEDLRPIQTETFIRATEEGLIWGVSTHTLAQLRDAVALRPSYVAYGPVLATVSKANPDPLVGFAGLADACRSANVPLVAIGGLDQQTGARALALGAQMVAVIGAVTGRSKEEIGARAVSLAQAFARAAAPLTAAQVHQQVPPLSLETLTEMAEYSDDLAIHVALGLPARFRPRVVDGQALYRPSDVEDLLLMLGKAPEESWSDWNHRGDIDTFTGPDTLVALRRPVTNPTSR